MNTPQWLKPGLYGAVLGAVALAIIGFSWGGWVTGSAAEQMASAKARQEVVAALVPICVAQSQSDPLVTQTIAKLREASNYQRAGLVMEAGWATMPGSSDPSRTVASACMDKLAAQF